MHLDLVAVHLFLRLSVTPRRILKLTRKRAAPGRRGQRTFLPIVSEGRYIQYAPNALYIPVNVVKLMSALLYHEACGWGR